MKLIDSFESGDLLYGFREDLESYIYDLKAVFKETKFFSQSHVNKDLLAQDSEHTAHLKNPTQPTPQVRRYGTMAQTKINYNDEGRTKEFYYFLLLNFNKHNLIETTGQCNLFKRVCKQGVQYAKQNNLKIHFILDSIYDDQREKSIVEKVSDSAANCSECQVDAVTAPELRSIYRDWKNLQNTVIFWYKNEQVPAPWLAKDHSYIWETYQPKSWQRNGFFSQTQQTTIDSVNEEQEARIRDEWVFPQSCRA